MDESAGGKAIHFDGTTGRPMNLTSLHDANVIEAFLRRDARLHLYELGDLDDFFFRHTTWWGVEERGQLAGVALLYGATELPVLVALGDVPIVREMLGKLTPLLPRRFYAHLTPGTSDVLAPWRREARGLHDRMILTDRTYLDEVDSNEAVPLGPRDAHDLEAFYASAYPSHWFDPRMLATGAYRGVRRNGQIVSAAGVHVLSRTRRVAAIGNVATNPAHRGRGLARVVCAALCRALIAEDIALIGLNVLASEASTIRLYEALGFTRAASYEELNCAVQPLQ